MPELASTIATTQATMCPPPDPAMDVPMVQAPTPDTDDDESSGTPFSLPGLVESSSDSDTEVRYGHGDGGTARTQRGEGLALLATTGIVPRGGPENGPHGHHNENHSRSLPPMRPSTTPHIAHGSCVGQLIRDLQPTGARARHYQWEPLPRPADLVYLYAATRHSRQAEPTRPRTWSSVHPLSTTGNTYRVTDVEAMLNNESERMEEVD